MSLLQRIKQQADQSKGVSTDGPDVQAAGHESVESSVPASPAPAEQQHASAPAAQAKAPLRFGLKRPATSVPADDANQVAQAGGGASQVRPGTRLVGGLDANVPAAPSGAESASSFDGPAGFALRLQVLESVIQGATGLDPTNIDLVKGHVKELMKELKTSPELRSIVKDTDVRNIMIFIRATAKNAEIQIETTQVKRAARTAKKANASLFLDAFDDLDSQVSLESLANMNTDMTETKTR